MAKPNWLTITPTSGSGNAQVRFSAISHTGRDARTYDATIVNSKVENCTVHLSQAGQAAAGATDIVSIQTTAAVEKTGGTVTLTGKSNASALTFSFKAGGTANISLPASYLANSVQTDNGASITGDPGSSSEYSFSITLNVPENESIEKLSSTLVVTTSGGATSQSVITVAAGDPYLWVVAEEQTEVTISIPQDGTEQTVQILSNDSWTIE